MKRIHITLLATAAAVALGGGAFHLGRSTAPRDAATAPVVASAASEGGRAVLYWHDPMVPGQRFDQPGKSPFMDMQLVPVYADEAGDSGVKISPQVQQNLGLRTALVERVDVARSFDAVGTVQFDERLSVAVQTRTAGFVERLAVRAPMERVVKGQALATLFVPEWLGPLNDIVALQRSGASDELREAARERSRAMSIPAELVQQAEAGATPRARYTLVAPAGGVVAELGVREGVAVTPGMTLFRIAGLGKVWAVAEVPESQALQLVRGQQVGAVLQADASLSFSGTVQEILPQVNAGTRTLQARFEVDNPGGRLVPGMLLRLRIDGPSVSRRVLPAEAVIRTGTRAVAIVRRDDGRFEPRELKLGVDLGERLEVLDGLAEGEQVVTSGQFLVDSEARLRSVLGSLAPAAPASAATATAPSTFLARGEVERVDADSITLSHGPVPALKWPAMTMGFGKPDPAAFAGVKPGDRVEFEFREGGPMDYELVTVRPLGGTR